jgi:hypothetical protein
LRAHECQSDKADELNCFAYTLVQRVSCKAHIVKRNLEPCRPQNAEEADVAEQVVAVGDGVVCGECCEVGYEEEIEEQFHAVGFVALRKDERVVICADKRRFNPWCGLMQTLQMLLFVAVQLLVWMVVSARAWNVHIALVNISFNTPKSEFYRCNKPCDRGI